MSLFDPEKLSVTIIPPASQTSPTIGRKYTLTHSDQTGQLFLDIGYIYNEKAINWKLRDEVLAEWKVDTTNGMSLLGNAHVDRGEYSKEEAGFRFTIFQKEMRTALKGILYGDRTFLFNYPEFLYAPIFIFYNSIYPEYKQVIYYGTPIQYVYSD